ncbi:hypothetical protein [Nocardia sp. NPDC058497]|uniref:hypothetical protein n=1 Tax=Nocardia sp. NPDC058497 TaxID=3346529 RepID=UPI003663DA4D
MSADVVIVGAGYAGISAAQRLAAAEHAVSLGTWTEAERARHRLRALPNRGGGHRHRRRPHRDRSRGRAGREWFGACASGDRRAGTQHVPRSADPLRMSCQAAIPSGIHAAETVLRLHAGQAPKPLRRRYIGQAVSLGRKNALVQFTDFTDRPLPQLVLTHGSAALLKEQICRATMRGGQLGPVRYRWS